MNDVALRANDVMFRINDVPLRANGFQGLFLFLGVKHTLHSALHFFSYLMDLNLRLYDKTYLKLTL